MSEGFANPIIGGGGALVYPSIHSPNFELGPPITGWSIDKNGDAFFSGVVGGTNFEITTAGAFFYSSTPGAGDLIGSIASMSGTDQYGNPYEAGLVSYASSGAATQIASGVLNFLDSAANFYQVLPIVLSAVPYLSLITPQGAVLVGGPAQTVNWSQASGAAEAWHALAPNAGFTSGSPAPRYQRLAVGSGGRVVLAGIVLLSANQAANATIFTLPSGYRPSKSQAFFAPNNLSGLGVGNGSIEVTTGGAIQIAVSGTNGDTVLLDGIDFPLD